MEIIEVQNKKKEVVADVICDCCGKSCKVFEYTVDNPFRFDYGEKNLVFEYMSMRADWGYHSKNDLTHWSAHVCEKCVIDKLVPIINFKKQQTTFNTTLK